MVEPSNKGNDMEKANAENKFDEGFDGRKKAFEDELDTLDSMYVYQKQDKTVSRIPLTLRQLCRMVCPKRNILNADLTYVMEYDPVTKEYLTKEWRLASSIPVLKSASGWWHYNTTGSTEPSVIGPVSCRDLVMKEQQLGQNVSISQVWSSTCCPEWSMLKDRSDLKLAMRAFEIKQNVNQVMTEEEEKKNIQMMTYQNDSDVSNAQTCNVDDNNAMEEEKAQKELHAFFTSTSINKNENQEYEEEEYTSDNGTNYVKCHRTGNWIHEDLAPSKATNIDDGSKNKKNNSLGGINGKDPKPNKKRKKTNKNKKQFKAKNYKNWIYVSNLPLDENIINEEVLIKYFSKVGMLDIDPETQLPKIKLYRDKNNKTLKGDASICYSRPESVDMAIQFLDESYLDDSMKFKIHVERAKFEQHGKTYHSDSHKSKIGISQAKHKVIRLAKLQAMGWEENTENGRISSGKKGLRIIVVENMFDRTDDLPEDQCESLERNILQQWDSQGGVEKITVFSKQGVVVIKFKQPHVASLAVDLYNGKEIELDGKMKKLKAIYWDGVTDYTGGIIDQEREEEDAKKRLDEFGDWLEKQEVPEEFQLRVEGDP